MERIAAVFGVVVTVLVLASGPVEAAPARPYEGPRSVSDPVDGEVELEPQPEQPRKPPREPPPGPLTPEDVAPAPEGSGHPRHSLVYRNLFGLRYNPLGLANELLVGYRLQFFERPGALFRDSFGAVHLHTLVTPANARVGPVLEVQPLAILNLQAGYDFRGYYSTFDQLQSFRTPTVDYDPDTLEELGDAGENYATYGHLVTLSALLQAKLGKVAFRNLLKFYWSDLRLREGDTVYYDQTLDMMDPDRGWVLTNDVDLVYLFDFGLKVGARHSLTHAFYQKRHFLPGEPVSQPNGPTQRVGPAALFTFYDRPERRFNKPTLVLLVQWWARHRWRTGAAVHAAVPWVVLAFVFEGQLLPDPRNSRR